MATDEPLWARQLRAWTDGAYQVDRLAHEEAAGCPDADGPAVHDPDDHADAVNDPLVRVLDCVIGAARARPTAHHLAVTALNASDLGLPLETITALALRVGWLLAKVIKEDFLPAGGWVPCPICGVGHPNYMTLLSACYTLRRGVLQGRFTPGELAIPAAPKRPSYRGPWHHGILN